MSIQISGSNLTTGFNNTVQSPPYGSISFNGLNQAVVTSGTGSGANNTVLDITTGSPSWTVECWIYTSQLSKLNYRQIFLNQGNAQNFEFSVNSGNDVSYITYGTNFLQMSFYSSTLGWFYLQSWPTAMSLNTWYHVAVCKDTSNGNRYYMYLNGVLVSSTPNIANPAVNQGQPWEFGMANSYETTDPSFAFNGLLSNIRIVKGQALYVPPVVSEPSLPLSATQSLNLLGYNQAITGTQTSLLLNTSYLVDASTYTQAVTGVNNPTSSTLAPYTYTAGNAGSILFNGSSQYLSVASSPILALSTSDFTVECWVNWSSLTTSAIIDNQSIGGFNLYYDAGVYLSNYLVVSNRISNQLTYSWVPGLNTWYHIAIARSGTTIRMFINGVLVTSATGNTTDYQAGIYQIGADLGSGGWYLNGYLSNLRIVKGVAVYTSAFVPSTTSLSSTQSANTNGNPSAAITGTQTSLLLNTTNDSNYLKDSSTNNFTVTNNGTATSNSLNPYAAGSILFNGTNQYLSIARATQFNYSTNDFTWEMWVYPTSSTWTTDIFYFIDHGPSSINQGSLHYFNNRLVYYNFYNYNNTPPYTSGVQYPSLYNIGGGSIPANTWTHIAISRQNLVTNMFINGQIVSSGPDPYNYAAISGSPFVNPIVSPASQSVIIGARSDGAYPFKGNISNVRIVNGVSVYNVGNFTPPVQPLPAVQAPNTIGSPSKSISSNQTSLLVNMPYNNNFLTDGSFNGVTLTQETTGYYPKSTYTLTNNSTNPFNSNGSIFTPGSIFFNGTSQYLSIPSNAALNFGTGDFTVEAWVNTTSANAGDFFIISSTGVGGFFFGYNSYGGNTSYGWGVTGLTWDYATGAPKTDGVWQHLAVTRSGTSMRIFVNGVQAGTTQTNSTAYDLSLTSTVVGWQSGAYYFPGYISNVRVVKGTAVYTQNFIPTSGPFTNNQTFNQSGIPSCPVQSSQTSLLLTTPSNTSFLTDSSTNAFTVTNNGSATSNPFNPFSKNYTILSNPGSVQFNGTSQYLTVPANSVLNLTADFTVETWAYATTTTNSADQVFNYGDVSFMLYHQGTTWKVEVGNGVSNYFTLSGTASLNAWHHFAITRSTNTYTFWIDGVSAATASNSNAPSTPGALYIGQTAAARSEYFTGYISNFRIVKGVAVYTSNFTPPAGPLNNSQAANQSGGPSAAVTSSQTSLLLNTSFGTNFLVDSSINNFTVTNVGTATSATLDPFVF